MKNEIAPRGQILTAAVLPVIVLALLCAVLAWFGWNWNQDAKAARVQAAHDRKEAADTTKRIEFLRTNKAKVDETWMELSAGVVRIMTTGPAAAGYSGSSGPSINVAEVPLNRGTAASSGLNGAARTRDLPEALSAMSEADYIIIPQPAGSDRSFRRFALGSDRIELGRLLPLLASVETRFPLALVEEAVLSLPAAHEVFSTKPCALESRFVVRLPLYDAAARQRDAKAKQQKAAGATPSALPGASPAKS